MKFQLDFLSDNYGIHDIDEPVGYADVDFQLKQKDKAYARDISFGGGESKFEFWHYRDHELEELFYYFNHFGYESKVQLVVDFENDLGVARWDLDFEDAETDELTYFKCKVIQDSTQQIIKRREEINTDVYSDTTLDDDPIIPLIPVNFLLKAKPIVQQSTWTMTGALNKTFVAFGQDLAVSSIFNTLGDYDIKNSFVPFTNYQELPSFYTESAIQQVRDEITLIRAVDNLSEVTIKINKLNAFAIDTGLGTRKLLRVVYGTTYDTGTESLITLEDTSGTLNLINKDYTVIIPFVPREGHIYLQLSIFQTYPTPAGTPVSTTQIQIQSESMEITVRSTSYNTVIPAFRLVDVMRYNIKSISGADILAPRFQSGGEFYDQFLFNGNSLRGIKDKPFYVTLKDISEGIIEMNADYEIQLDNKVFFGLYPDFYTGVEMAFLTDPQHDTFNKSFNERFALNQFNYKYSRYQSQKENTEQNTYDVVHGETQWLFGNTKVENKKDVVVKWTRDAFALAFAQQQAVTATPSTATQDDDNLYCIDAIEIINPDERTFTESATLQHTYFVSTGYNTLTNDGSFNWTLLGLVIGDSFEIINTSNAGVHTIVSVTPSVLTLDRLSAGASSSNGVTYTTFKYTIDASVIYKNWTNEGFTTINGLNNGNNYANLRFSVKSNIVKYWNKYIASANLYVRKVIKNTFYKNNPDCETVYQGLYVKEGESFLPDEPILSPMQYNEMVFIVDFEEYIELQNKTRTDRGFIRVIDNNDHVVKVYPKLLKYVPEESKMTIIAEEKYEPATMTITTAINGIILINGETRLHDILFEFIGEILYIYDENEELMYNGVQWDKVSINGVIATSKSELNGWLSLL